MEKQPLTMIQARRLYRRASDRPLYSFRNWVRMHAKPLRETRVLVGKLTRIVRR